MSTKHSRTVLNAAMTLAQEDAYRRRNDAANQGSHGDGGASRILELVAAYNDGLNGRSPDFLRPYLHEALARSDPEWEEYQRLHAKFAR